MKNALSKFIMLIVMVVFSTLSVHAIQIGSFTLDDNSLADAVTGATGSAFGVGTVDPNSPISPISSLNTLPIAYDLVNSGSGFTQAELDIMSHAVSTYTVPIDPCGLGCQFISAETEVATTIANATENFQPLGDGFLDIAFTDNSVVNGAGDDLILFDGGNVSQQASVTINGITISQSSTITNDSFLAFAPTDAGIFEFDLSYVSFDLTDFGIALGDAIDSFTLDMSHITPTGLGPTSFGLTAVAALNNGAPLNQTDIPEPATILLLGSALLGGFVKRKGLFA